MKMQVLKIILCFFLTTIDIEEC